MSRRTCSILTAVALLVLTGCTAHDVAADPSSSAASADAPAVAEIGGTLYFTRTHGADVQTAFQLNSGSEQVIAEAGEICCILRASPSGEKLLVMPGQFASPIAGATLSPTTGAVAELPSTHPTLNLVPQAWSPDGALIAYEGWDDSDPARTGIYVGAADGQGTPTAVTSRLGPLHDVPLDFSPDGSQMVYYRSAHPDPDPYTGGSLWVVNLDGTGAHQISTEATPPTVWARWSPDGSEILFAAERLASAGPIWTVAPAGGEPELVYQDPGGGFAIYPVWSPDGSQILFGLDPTNDEFTHPNNKVFVMSAAGTNVQLVIDSPDCKRTFDWVD